MCVGQALVNAGEITVSDIRFHEDRNRLYRVLGSEGNVRATIRNEEVMIQPGDAFFLVYRWFLGICHRRGNGEYENERHLPLPSGFE